MHPLLKPPLLKLLPVKLYEAIYISTLHENSPVWAIANIAAKARIANAAREITGLLVFDGLHFCQQIEGSQKMVLQLLEKISGDARHKNMQILHHQASSQRRFSGFSLGYALIENQSETLIHMEKLDGPVAFESFMRLVPTLDM